MSADLHKYARLVSQLMLMRDLPSRIVRPLGRWEAESELNLQGHQLQRVLDSLRDDGEQTCGDIALTSGIGHKLVATLLKQLAERKLAAPTSRTRGAGHARVWRWIVP